MLILETQGEGGRIYRQGIHNCVLICFQNSSVLSLIVTVEAGTGAGEEKQMGAQSLTYHMCALCEILWSRK